MGSLEKLAADSGVVGGVFTAIGAVSKAAFAYYDQASHKYMNISKEGGFEIVSCMGSFGVLDGRPRIHCHLALAGRDGNVLGGHLLPGTEVFVGEVHLTEVKDVRLERKVDPETGLAMFDF
jgi:hypothetical protein